MISVAREGCLVLRTSFWSWAMSCWAACWRSFSVWLIGSGAQCWCPLLEAESFVPDCPELDLSFVRPVIYYGLTATLHPRDGHRPFIAMQRLPSFPKGAECVLLATGRYIGEGFDDSRLDTLFLAMPVSWKGTLVQYAGRLHRLYEGKREVRIYDYVDQNVPILTRMYEKRLKGYRTMGYTIVQ